MLNLKSNLILGLSSSLLLSPLLASAQDSLAEQHVEPKFESKLLTEQDDTFSIIAYREFGHVEVGLALAEYNQIPFNTVFGVAEELVYPAQFATKPSSIEVVYSKGNVNYLPVSREHSTGQVIKGDLLFPIDVVETGPDGFVSLKLPSGASINVQPQSRFTLEQLRCLPDDVVCAVLVDEENGTIYLNIKVDRGHPGPFTITTPYQEAAVRVTVFDFEFALRSQQSRDWPVQVLTD